MIGSLHTAKDSYIHRFDPRLKLVVLLLFTVVFFLPKDLIYLLGAFLMLGALVIICSGIRSLLRPLRTILPILILVLFLTPPFNRTGRILWAPLPFVTDVGLRQTVRLILRFSGITVSFAFFMTTTDPDQLILALRFYGIPFSMALVLTITLRYIPYLNRLYHSIEDAHKLRLSQPHLRRHFFQRFRALIPVLTSLLIQSVRTIPNLAMALETRGVGRRNRRTSLAVLKSGKPIVADLGITALIITLFFTSLFVFQ